MPGIEHKLQRIEFPGDPEQCQAVHATQQCPYKRVPGSQYCQRHSGTTNQTLIERDKARTYRLQVWKERVGEFADDEKIKSIREEISILRLLLETQINQCHNEQDLLINSHKISDLVMKLDKVVSSCHTLEMKMSLLLDRNSILQLGSMVVEIIAAFIPGSDEREEAATKIMEALTTTIVVK